MSNNTKWNKVKSNCLLHGHYISDKRKPSFIVTWVILCIFCVHVQMEVTFINKANGMSTAPLVFCLGLQFVICMVITLTLGQCKRKQVYPTAQLVFWNGKGFLSVAVIWSPIPFPSGKHFYLPPNYSSSGFHYLRLLFLWTQL